MPRRKEARERDMSPGVYWACTHTQTFKAFRQNLIGSENVASQCGSTTSPRLVGHARARERERKGKWLRGGVTDSDRDRDATLLYAALCQ